MSSRSCFITGISSERIRSELTIATANDGTVPRALDLGRCLALTRNESSSSLEAGFSQVDVVLDATKDSVIDRFFVA